MTVVQPRSRAADIPTGITIILLPVVAALISPVLALFLLGAAGLIAVPGYLVLVVIAATGYFGTRPVFGNSYPVRPGIAGIGHGICAVALVLFVFLDGDAGRPGVPLLLIAAALGFYAWLVIEWLVALRVGRRPRTAGVGSAPYL